MHRHVYRPFDHWRRHLPGDVELVRAPREEPPPSLDGFSHLIVSGSEASILDDEPWVPPQLALIRRAVDQGLAVLGSCHGHQMVAVALAGRGVVARASSPELGWISIEVDADDPMFAASNGTEHVFVSHLDEVVDLPGEFVVTARSRRCSVHAFRHRERPVWGLQSHPEIGVAEGERLLRAFAALDERVAGARIARPPRDSGVIAAVVAAFLEGAAGIAKTRKKVLATT